MTNKTPYADLAKAMSEMKNPAFNTVNPFLKNKYADLKAVSDACRSALLDNNIMALQSYEHRQFGEGDDFMIVWGICTKLVHASGEVLLDSFYPINGALDDQKKGSASTYGRRYSLVMACGLVGDPDDDGNAASAPEKKQAKPKTPNEKELKWLQDKIAITQTEEAKFLQAMNVDSLEQVDFAMAIQALSRKEEKMKSEGLL